MINQNDFDRVVAQTKNAAHQAMRSSMKMEIPEVKLPEVEPLEQYRSEGRPISPFNPPKWPTFFENKLPDTSFSIAPRPPSNTEVNSIMPQQFAYAIGCGGSQQLFRTDGIVIAGDTPLATREVKVNIPTEKGENIEIVQQWPILELGGCSAGSMANAVNCHGIVYQEGTSNPFILRAIVPRDDNGAPQVKIETFGNVIRLDASCVALKACCFGTVSFVSTLVPGCNVSFEMHTIAGQTGNVLTIHANASSGGSSLPDCGLNGNSYVMIPNVAYHCPPVEMMRYRYYKGIVICQQKTSIVPHLIQSGFIPCA